MKAQERLAATRAMRGRLQQIRDAVAAQDAQLAEAHARMDPRAAVTLTPEARERFELLCTPPVCAAGGMVEVTRDWTAVRC